jgi:hypothetical protein
MGMRIYSRLLLMLVIASFAGSVLHAQTQPSTDWTRYNETWKKFLDNPNNATLQAFYDILPESGKIFVEGDGMKTVDAISNGIDTLFYHLISTNDMLVAKTAFRLFAFAPVRAATDTPDGKRSKEPINIMFLAQPLTPLEKNIYRVLSKCFTIETTTFMKELLASRAFVPSLELVMGGFLLNPANEVDMQTLQLEKKSRISVLENLDDKSLVQIRAECLSIMKRL